MKFLLTNIGPIKKAELGLGSLTVICGKNNSGKTYISYSIYGFLDAVHHNIDLLPSNDCIDILLEKGTLRIELDSILENIEKKLEDSSTKYSKRMHDEFGASKDEFVKSKFQARVDKSDIDCIEEYEGTYRHMKKKVFEVIKKENNRYVDINIVPQPDGIALQGEVLRRFINFDLSVIVFGKICRNVFILTSERTGISLFYKELDMYRNALIEEMGRKSFKSRADFMGIFDNITSRYARPIQDSINYTRDFEQIMKKKSELCSRECNSMLQQILMGKFRAINKQLFFCVQSGAGLEDVNVPLHRTSSAIKSLFALDLYIRCLAKPGDMLMIDEPELNLHPDNQRQLARLLAMLVNYGIRVFVTTHSDFVVKEFNNLIMLSNEFRGKKALMKKFGYNSSQVLSHDAVKIYVSDDETLREVEVVRETGFGLDTFDSVICEMNKSTESIVYHLGL